MPRSYGPLGSNIWFSDKFNRLENDTNRLGFVYLVSCDHANPIGLFRLPHAVVADERDMEIEDVRAMFRDLEAVGMIETGPQGFVRVKRWFHEVTGPSNPDRAFSVCSYFMGRPMERAGRLRINTLVEYLIAVEDRSSRWKTSTDAYDRLVKRVVEILHDAVMSDPEAVAEEFRPAPVIQQHGFMHTVSDMVSRKVPPASWHMLHAALWDTMSDTMSDTMGDIEKEKEKEKEREKGREIETGIVKGIDPEGTRYPMTIDEHLEALKKRSGER